jgi:hypothetical protein
MIGDKRLGPIITDSEIMPVRAKIIGNKRLGPIITDSEIMPVRAKIIGNKRLGPIIKTKKERVKPPCTGFDSKGIRKVRMPPTMRCKIFRCKEGKKYNEKGRCVKDGIHGPEMVDPPQMAVSKKVNKPKTVVVL